MLPSCTLIEKINDKVYKHLKILFVSTQLVWLQVTVTEAMLCLNY